MLPKITIGITCFNAEDTIGDAILSAQQQTYGNFEIIVVDDCSTDNSVAVIENAIAGAANARLIRHEQNTGVAGGYNSIVTNAQGEFVAFFDDDDTNDNTKLEKQHERLTAYEKKAGTDFVFCYTNRKVFYPGDTEPREFRYAIGRTAPEPHGEMVADYLTWNSGVPGHVWGFFGAGTLMTRKTTFEKVGPFDLDFRRCSEWDLAFRAARLGAHFIAVDEPLLHQHITPTTDKAGRRPLQFSLLLREKHKNFLRKKGVYHSARMIARARFFGSIGQMWKARFFSLLACLLSPHRAGLFVLRKWLRKGWARLQNQKNTT